MESLLNVQEDRAGPVAFFVVDEDSREDQLATCHRKEVKVEQTLLVHLDLSLYFSNELETSTAVKDADSASDRTLNVYQLHFSVHLLFFY